MADNNDKFEAIKNKAKEFYDQIKKVRCPYLGEEVNFNEEGFGHLLSKSWNKGRSFEEQYIRLRILPKAVEVIKISHTLQEYDEKQMFVRQKSNSCWQKKMKLVRYYVFVALLRNHDFRLKIVIKEIDGGQPFFWSIYPSWKTIQDSGGNRRKIFYSGNLEED